MGQPEQNPRNDYLEEVMAKQQQVQSDLRARKKMVYSATPVAQSAEPALAAPVGAAAPGRGAPIHPRALRQAGMPLPEPESVGNAVDVRITGWWRWKTVIVPPNAYVVHTRRGRTEPVDIGMGISFKYNPYTDSFLVVPATMQTILINAHCICRELQGLLVQGYVQWIIADFATAYRKLDFTDVEDPMRVVNVQLREQAEAAIKDKVATMAIDDVLSDKQPIIEELTARLRQVAEGEGGSDKGLGLRIVTVQIKEAVVSSPRLWENLQKPFRAERGRIARLAELEAESVIAAREQEHRNRTETAEIEIESKLNQQRAEAAHQELLKQLELQIAETARQAEAARAAHVLELEKVAKAAEIALEQTKAGLVRDRTAAEGRLALERARFEVANAQASAENELLAEKQKVLNGLTPAALQLRLLEQLPALAEKLPKPAELKAVSIGGDGASDARSLAALVAQVMALVDGFRPPRAPNGKTPGA